MADEARLHELLDLVEQARNEGDKATEAKAVAAYKRESAPAQPFPDTYGGAGGYNPMLPRLSGTADAAASAVGIQPGADMGAANAAGPAEMAMHLGSAGASLPVSGVAGIGQGLWNSIVPKSMEGMPAGDRVRQVQEAMTYQPRTAVGQGMSHVMTAPQAAYSAGTNYLGEKTTDITGSPAAGAFVKTLGDVGPAVLSRGEAGALERPTGKYARDAVPTKEQLGDAATAAYKRADDSGIAMKAESFDKMRAGLVDDLTKGGIDPTLHPKATAALGRIVKEEGPITLQKAETLRRVALDAEDTLEKSDARNAGKIVDALDDYVDNLKDSDLVSGNVKDAAALKEARALYTRKRKADDIERLIKRAEYSPSGFENGLRIEFRSLAKNDRRFNRYNTEEKAAINKVAKGGAVENTLRLLGKAAPTGIVSGGLSSGAGFAFGGPVGALAVPAVGIAGRLGAKALTARNATRAAETMRRGPYQEPPPLQMPQPMQAAGELMPREPLALPAPNIISGQRSAPGSMYAREQMGMTPDVERAGMQHPGMARQTIPQRPLALPHLPQEAASPFVVDAQGRAATNPEQLSAYLRQMGFDNVRAKGEPKKGLFDSVDAKEPTPRASSQRTSTQIRLELQRLLVQMRSAPGGADALYAQGLKRRWDQLQGELRQQLSRESSGAATSPRPTK